MNKKQKELSLSISYFDGKTVKIWTNRESKTPFCWGVVEKFTGSYLVFKEIEFWNGKKHFDYLLHSNTIKKIVVK